jgi:hypothetical protein
MFSLLSFLFIAFCVFYIIPTVILPAISGSSATVFLLAVLVSCGLPTSFVIMYLALKLVAPATEKAHMKGLRPWVTAYIIIGGYLLSWGLLAFIFETFAPFLPLFFRVFTLPILILLIIMIVVSKTRLLGKKK